MGLAFAGMMLFPFFCHERGGCSFAVVTPWSALGWAQKAAVALFVTAGLSLILRGLRLQLLSQLLALALVLLFGVLLNAIIFGMRAPACGPLIGAMRVLAEVPAYLACQWWPTLAAWWIDAFFIGFALEAARKQFLPETTGTLLQKLTEGILLVALSPLLVLMLALLVPTIGTGALKGAWARWRGK